MKRLPFLCWLFFFAFVAVHPSPSVVPQGVCCWWCGPPVRLIEGADKQAKEHTNSTRGAENFVHIGETDSQFRTLSILKI
jgi:hypothetical protein